MGSTDHFRFHLTSRSRIYVGIYIICAYNGNVSIVEGWKIVQLIKICIFKGLYITSCNAFCMCTYAYIYLTKPKTNVFHQQSVMKMLIIVNGITEHIILEKRINCNSNELSLCYDLFCVFGANDVQSL